MKDISELVEIMARLRDPANGCPWDREQTFRTIAPYTIEEAYEVAEAIETGAIDRLPDELGDLLFQVVFHAQMAREAGLFGFGDVVDAICRKMVRRHPHVFGDATIDSAAAQTRSWESIKRDERARADAGSATVLAGIAAALPALVRAQKLGRRAAGVGFDWPDSAGARAKIDEELAEIDAAVASGDAGAIEAELGDVLFAVVNLCRHRSVDPEQALRGANERFANRFAAVEYAVAASGRSWSEHTLDELDAYWHAAKQELANAE